MRTLSLIFCLLVLIGCDSEPEQTEVNPEVEAFLSALDSLSLEEVKTEMNDNIDQLDSFLSFFESSFEQKVQSYAKTDERYDEVFKVDTSQLGARIKNRPELAFIQKFSEDSATLQFINEERNQEDLGLGVGEKFIPKKIYYHDSSSTDENIEDFEINYHFDMDWGKAIGIDSVDILHRISYQKDNDIVTISEKNPVVSYKGGEIRLEKITDNYAYVTLSDTIPDVYLMEGYSEEGKILSSSGSSNDASSPENSEKVISQLVDYLRGVQEKLNDDDFKTTDELKEYLRSGIARSGYFNDSDGMYHMQKYFYGNVKSLKLYFETDVETIDATLNAKNLNPFTDEDDLFPMPVSDGIAFVNSLGEQQIVTKGAKQGLEKMGGDFYEDNGYFYVLNREARRLDTLLVNDVVCFNKGLVGILRERQEDDFELFNYQNKSITSKTYENIYEIGNVIVGFRDNVYYVLDSAARETAIKGVVGFYGKVVEGMIGIYDAQRRYGYMTSEGTIAIPMQYSNIFEFEGGITLVQKDKHYKLIDITGKTIRNIGETRSELMKEDEAGNRIYTFNFGDLRFDQQGNPIE